MDEIKLTALEKKILTTLYYEVPADEVIEHVQKHVKATKKQIEDALHKFLDAGILEQARIPPVEGKLWYLPGHIDDDMVDKKLYDKIYSDQGRTPPSAGQKPLEDLLPENDEPMDAPIEE